jgi:hypothetical protein
VVVVPHSGKISFLFILLQGKDIISFSHLLLMLAKSSPVPSSAGLSDLGILWSLLLQMPTV